MFRAVFIGACMTLVLSACSKLPTFDDVAQDNRRAYRKAVSLEDLEVPPDLSTDAIRDRMAIPEGGDAARYSTYQERQAERERQAEVERSQTSAIRVLENEHVLAVDGAPVQVWPKLEAFWQGLGYTLELNDVELGVIETAWIEDEGELSRTKFKVFAEADDAAGTTVLYVSHEVEELVPQGEDLVWQRGTRNEDLERRVVERLQEHVTGGAPPTAVAEAAPAAAPSAPQAAPGDLYPTAAPDAGAAPAAPVVGTEAPATTGPRSAELVSVGGGKVYLTVDQDFPTAWKTTGRALERVGVDVRDSDKGRGVYVVGMAAGAAAGESAGVWKKLKFWDRDRGSEYQVSLTGVGDKTEVVVLDKEGRWETGENASEILSKLHDALNSGQI